MTGYDVIGWLQSRRDEPDPKEHDRAGGQQTENNDDRGEQEVGHPYSLRHHRCVPK
jgi:hypothetical protein